MGASVRATMYRAILKAGRRLSDPRGTIAFVEPVNPRSWGQGNFLPRPTQPSLCYLHGVPPRYSDVAAEELADLDVFRSDEGFCFDEIRRLVRRCFEHSTARQHSAEPEGSGEPDALEDGFMALRLLASQQQLRDCSSVRVSGPGIRIECTADCVDEMAPPPGDPKHGHHAFAYRVSIENVGKTACRVLGRHWFIRERDSGEEEVVPHGSPGIVGYTPVLKPGQRFVYGSGTLLDCDEGSMWGSLQCEELLLPDDTTSEVDDDYEALPHGSGVAFDAEIGTFLLRVP
jgi:ApaG protein